MLCFTGCQEKNEYTPTGEFYVKTLPSRGDGGVAEVISLEAELYNAEGKVLASRRQIAGISLSSFQLEVLDKTELENTLNRKLDIITSNINVMPGAEVPFTVVFSEIPAGASDYKVRIAGASEPAPVGNLSK